MIKIRTRFLKFQIFAVSKMDSSLIEYTMCDLQYDMELDPEHFIALWINLRKK